MSNRISVLPVIALLIASLLLLTSCSGSDPISPSNNEGVIEQLSHEDSPSGGLELTQSDQAFSPSSQTDDILPYAPNQVLITLNAEYIQKNYIAPQQPDTNGDRTSILDQYGVSFREGIDAGWSMVYVLEIIDGASVPDKVAELESLPEVELAEPNYRYDFCDVPYTPNDPLWENQNDLDEDPRTTVFEQFGPSKIGANVVWNDTFGNPSVVVCVIDSGIAYDHEDLENVMWINEAEIPDNEIDDDSNDFVDDIYGWDFYEDDNDIKEYNNDEYYHGTSCAGVIATEHDNGLGCAGIAPGSRLMGVRIGFGYSYLSVLLGGVKYARDNGADILSMSFSGTEYSSILKNSMIYAWNDGLVLVAAASNDDNQELHYPAAYDSVVCVGGTSPFGKRWSYQPIDEIRISKSAGFYWGSNYGPQLEVMAFGEFYITTRGNNVTSY
ncbi:S8 family serine peptidase, partial [bacterium]|nr:S8 family serine peptidase [bacterium]